MIELAAPEIKNIDLLGKYLWDGKRLSQVIQVGKTRLTTKNFPDGNILTYARFDPAVYVFLLLDNEVSEYMDFVLVNSEPDNKNPLSVLNHKPIKTSLTKVEFLKKLNLNTFMSGNPDIDQLAFEFIDKIVQGKIKHEPNVQVKYSAKFIKGGFFFCLEISEKEFSGNGIDKKIIEDIDLVIKTYLK